MDVKKRIHRLINNGYWLGIVCIIVGVLASATAIWFGRHLDYSWYVLVTTACGAPIGCGAALIILERR